MELEKPEMLKVLEKSKTLEELEKANDDVGDLVDAGGDTGGLEAVHYGYPVPGEIIRRSGTISTSKLTSRPLLFQTNIPAS